MSRNGLAILRAVMAARAEATEKFGHPSQWDKPLVSKWVQRRVQEITGQAPVERVNYVDRERD